MPLNQVQLVGVSIGGLTVGTAENKDVSPNQNCGVTPTWFRCISRERCLLPSESIGVKDVHIVEAPDALHAPTKHIDFVPNFHGSMALSS